MIINSTGKPIIIKSGTSDLTTNEVKSLEGYYTMMTKDFSYPPDAVILPLMPIAKKAGFRFVAQLNTEHVQSTGATFPHLKSYGFLGLDLRETVTTTLTNYAFAPKGSGLMIIDVSNAYARIRLNDSNMYTRDKDGQVWRLDQPVQGLATAGTLAPHLLTLYFKRMIRTIRQKLKKKYGPTTVYLHGHNYSDNLMLVSSLPGPTFSLVEQHMGPLLNREQSQIVTMNNYTRTLGLRWKIGLDKALLVRRPQRTNEFAESTYDYLMGARPTIRVEIDRPLTLYVDGVSDQDYKATASAGLFQGENIIQAIVRTKVGIEQNLSESQALVMGSQLRREANRSEMVIHTDSNINKTIAESPNPRETIEFKIVGDISDLQFTPGKDNLADPLTRDPELIERFTRKRPRRAPRPQIDLETEWDQILTPPKWKRAFQEFKTPMPIPDIETILSADPNDASAPPLHQCPTPTKLCARDDEPRAEGLTI